MTRAPRTASPSTGRLLCVLVLAVTALGTAGCTRGSATGKDSSVTVKPVENPVSLYEPGHRPDAQGVAEVTAVLARALARGDGHRVCSLMGKTAQQRIVKAQKSGNCLDATTALAADLSTADRDRLQHLQATTVTVTSTTATATLSEGAGGSTTSDAVFGSTPAFTLSEERWALQ